MSRIADAQWKNAELYRRYEKQSPWNSQTRQQWRKLAEAAENMAALNEE